jgi:hypothetical protein
MSDDNIKRNGDVVCIVLGMLVSKCLIVNECFPLMRVWWWWWCCVLVLNGLNLWLLSTKSLPWIPLELVAAGRVSAKDATAVINSDWLCAWRLAQSIVAPKRVQGPFHPTNGTPPTGTAPEIMAGLRLIRIRNPTVWLSSSLAKLCTPIPPLHKSSTQSNLRPLPR